MQTDADQADLISCPSLPSAIKFVETECSRYDAEKCITDTSAALLGHPQGVLYLVSSAPNICDTGQVCFSWVRLLVQIEALGDYLVATEDANRAKALLLVSEVRTLPDADCLYFMCRIIASKLFWPTCFRCVHSALSWQRRLQLQSTWHSSLLHALQTGTANCSLALYS